MREIDQRDCEHGWADTEQDVIDQLRADNLAISLQVKALLDALDYSSAFIDATPHGDNCFVSDHYEGDPGNRCNCGKDSAVAYLQSAITTTDNSAVIIAAHDAEVRKDYFELREVATLAWRVLDECGPVISAIDPEDSGEQDGLDDLHKRLTEVAGSLFCVIRNPKISMAEAIDSPDADTEVTK